MTQEATEIEVEVVEIDGVAPTAPQTRDPEPAQQPREDRRDWRHWQGRVRKLDTRWWPLWVLLGIIPIALALAVGVVIGMIYLVFRVTANFVRSLLR